MTLTKLERVYVLDLAKRIKRTEEITKGFSSNKLKRYFELYLAKETVGGIKSISKKDFMMTMEIAGFKSVRMIPRSPQFYFNVCEKSIIEIFGSII